VGTSPRPLPGPESESPLAQISDEVLIRRYCAALATGTTDEEAARELWHQRHKPILLQKIKYIAAKPGQVRPDVIDFGPFVEASLGWAWQKYFGGIRGLKNPGSKPALLTWLERSARSGLSLYLGPPSFSSLYSSVGTSSWPATSSSGTGRGPRVNIFRRSVIQDV